ncbi:uncharacterized protein LACBIDRAFT_302570 [Laccaria bicolor S238N-H82]|uniref:Predicted protein n=1 Tax=Laccaria bicolor (strain S238N-H82 / ATCC MYA-4686) TaxID=486041 RepID=B0DHX0_LACBS|nr:uncharacterized protein LACBIDRAFT_302570 [Laccaria bicolor S238N-H82]EDR05802.1 predicted protein [Laccaria bicolor S238N-H82]|eukprot:XP_001883478.1 predicted protein [Laccaria bicolor S238N-H82]
MYLLTTSTTCSVMGPTGAGKSTFINMIAGEDQAKVGPTMESETKELKPIIIDVQKMGLDPSRLALLNGKRLILLDTPGFDDTAGHEAVILRRIAIWLARSYKNKQQSLGGIIHLHDITQSKMSISLKRSLEVFSCLCGDSAYRRIALGTTKWPPSESPAGPQSTRAKKTHGSPRDQAESRFSQLETMYWKDLMKSGSWTYRIETEEHASELVGLILDELEKTTKELELQIQKEVVDEGKAVPKTKAGKILEVSRNRNRYGASMTEEDREVERCIQAELDEMDRQLAELATNKNKFSRVSRSFKRLATRVFGSVCCSC